jgi:hypothetical protein
MTTTTETDRTRTANLLVALYNYVRTYTPSHPVLLPAVFTLDDAAALYGRNAPQQAFEKGVEVYQLLKQASLAFPTLPDP